MKEGETRYKPDIGRASRYGLAGIAGTFGGLTDLVRRAHMASADYFPHETIYNGVKDRIAQYGQEKAAIIDLLIMAGGFLAVMRAAVISETPAPPRKASPLYGKEFPDDIYDLEHQSR